MSQSKFYIDWWGLALQVRFIKLNYIFYNEKEHIESFHRSNHFHFAVFWSIQCYKFWKKKFRKKIEDARNNLIDMHKLSWGIF